MTTTSTAPSRLRRSRPARAARIAVDLRRAPLTPGTVRVAIKAAGINFPDLLMIEGRYQRRPQLPFVPGQEAAEIIAETTPEVDALQVGQKVIIRMQTGGYAEEAIVPADQILAASGRFLLRRRRNFFRRAHHRLPRARH